MSISCMRAYACAAARVSLHQGMCLMWVPSSCVHQVTMCELLLAACFLSRSCCLAHQCWANCCMCLTAEISDMIASLWMSGFVQYVLQSW